MFTRHTKMLCDPIELCEAILLEIPFENGKVDFRNVDLKTLRITYREIRKAIKLTRKITKFNGG